MDGRPQENAATLQPLVAQVDKLHREIASLDPHRQIAKALPDAYGYLPAGGRQIDLALARR
jgi:hypothetical protein